MSSGFDLVPLTPQKTDPAWKHCQMFKNENRVHLKCVYCNKVLKGGGIHRIKEHLAGHKGNASTCLQVPEGVRLLMQQSLAGAVSRRRKKQKINEVIANIQQPSNEGDTLVTLTQEGGSITAANIELLPVDFDSSEHHQPPVVNQDGRIDKNKVRRKRPREKAVSDLVSIKDDPNVSPRKASVNNNNMHIAIGRFLYDIGAPMNAVNSIYFQPMIDAVASSGSSGVVGPSYHDMRGQVLKKVVEEVKSDVAKYASTWERTGCSLIVEQWNTDKGRVFLSFLVHCPEGKVSLKSVDATQFIHSSDILLQVLIEVLGEVGVKNVLQVITNDDKHFVDAGKRLMDMYPNLYWAPCSAQCIDLILKDFGEIDWIRSIIQQAQSITRFVYNHATMLNLLRKYTCGVDIVYPGRSCFATNFMTLRRIVEQVNNLKSMFTSQEWKCSPYSDNSESSEIVDFVHSEEFWSSCARITRLTSPLLRLKRIVTSERKASIGYVYAGMYRAREAIKMELSGEMDYKEYWRIIDKRWRCHGSQPLHAAGFYLNPKFFYSIKGDLPGEVVSGMFDCIERLVRDAHVQDMISREISLYKSSSGDFGRKMAVRAKDLMLPGEGLSLTRFLSFHLHKYIMSRKYLSIKVC